MDSSDTVKVMLNIVKNALEKNKLRVIFLHDILYIFILTRLPQLVNIIDL